MEVSSTISWTIGEHYPLGQWVGLKREREIGIVTRNYVIVQKLVEYIKPYNLIQIICIKYNYSKL